MVSLDAVLQAIAALVTGSFGVMLLAQAERRDPPRILGFFLLLIAANQAIETVRTMTADPREALLLFRLASVAAALDPVVLYVFASRYPEPNALGRPPWLALVIAWGAGMAAWASVITLNQLTWNERWFGFFLNLETTLLYGVVVVWSTLRLCAQPGERGNRVLFVALMVMAFPVLGRLISGIQGVTPLPDAFLVAGDNKPYYLVSTLLGLSVALAAFMAWLWPRADADTRRLAAWSLAGGFTLHFLTMITGFTEVLSTHFGVGQPMYAFVYLGRASTSIRWLLFCGLASVAFFRHDVLGLSLAARRRAARLVIAVSMLVLAGLVIALLPLAVPGASYAPSPPEVVVLAAAVALSQGFRNGVDRVALRFYGVPMPGDRIAAQELYRKAAAEAMRRGGPISRDPALQRLRAELDIDPASAAILEELADRTGGGPLAVGQVVAGRYRAERLLGHGGGGRAFLAEDETLHRQVVLKEVPDAGDRAGEVALREARVAGSLQHPHVVTLYDVLQRPGAAILVTEYLPGGSLEDKLQAGPLPPAQAREVVTGLLRGLAAVHAQGIVHRDVKPSNVLLGKSGAPKLGDFGLARLRVTQTVAFDRSVKGTPGYMAPEQMRGEPATPASDVYAVGLVARRCAAWPPEAEAVLVRALEADPQRRWRDAGEMLAALESAPQSFRAA